jgi:hypothetical protein
VFMSVSRVCFWCVSCLSDACFFSANILGAEKGGSIESGLGISDSRQKETKSRKLSRNRLGMGNLWRWTWFSFFGIG